MLSAVARDKGLTIKEAARKALVEWSVSELDLRQDPLFLLKPVRFRERVRVSGIDRLLYGSQVALSPPSSTHHGSKHTLTRGTNITGKQEA